MNNIIGRYLALTLVTATLVCGTALAQSTAISYQGKLADANGALLSGSYDLAFALFDDADPSAPDNQIGSTVSLPAVQITDGHFSVLLDFGADAFDGGDRWLQVSVNGTALGPRQAVANSPQSIFARKPWEKSAEGIHYAGKVGIGTSTPQAALHVHSPGSPAAIDQQSHWNNFGSSTHISDGWQSFTAAASGQLTRIDVGFYNNQAQPGSFKVYKGTGTAGEVIYSEDLWLNQGGWMAFTLWTPVYIQAGQVYTWRVTGNYGFGSYFDTRSASYSGGQASVSAGSDFAFRTWVLSSPPSDFVIDSESGYVGIGTDAPQALLDVAGNIRCVSLTQTSSRSLKQDIHPISGALETVMKLQGVSYRWARELGGSKDIGFVAEDVGAVVPEVVTWEKPGEKALGINYGHLTAIAFEAIKEQQAQIDELKKQNELLRRDLDKIRK